MTIENTGDANFQKPTLPTRSRRIFHFLLAGVFWLMAIEGLTGLYHDADKFGLDFYNFWVGGDIIRTNQASAPHQPIDLYSQQGFHKFGAEYFSLSTTKPLHQREAASYWRVLETTGTPFFYCLFSIATRGDYDRDYTTYIIFSLACLTLSIVALSRRLNYSIAGIGLSLALASMSAPVHNDLNVANVNCPELLLCTTYLLLRNMRQRGRFWPVGFLLSGCALGFLLAFKPNLLLPLFLLNLSQFFNNRRAWAIESAACVLTLVAAIAISSHAFGGFHCWISWAAVVRDLTRIGAKSSEYGNFSLSQTIYEQTGKNVAAVLSAMLIAAAVGVVFLTRRSGKNPAGSSHAVRSALFRSSPVSRASRPCLRFHLRIFDGLSNTQAGTAETAVIRESSETEHLGSHSLQSDTDLCHDLTIFGVGTAITFLSAGLAWLHYPVLIFPFLLILGSPLCAQKTARWVPIARFVVLSMIVLLLLIPPPVEILDLLPAHRRIGSSTQVHCTQGAILIVLFTGMGLFVWERVKRSKLTRRGATN